MTKAPASTRTTSIAPSARRIPGIKLSEGGMGISIIRAVVDGFDLRAPTAGGTVLLLTKLRDG